MAENEDAAVPAGEAAALAREPGEIAEGANDQKETFKTVLRDIVGITNEQQINRLSTHGGIEMAEDMAYIDSDSLMDIFTANNQPTAMVKMRLRAFKTWVDTRIDNFGTIDVNEFNHDECKKVQRSLARRTHNTPNNESKQPDSSTTKLSKFDGKTENWEDNKRNLIARLNQTKNTDGTPLYYIIRDEDEEDHYCREHGEVGRKIYDAVMHGWQYDQDAFKVLQILKEWTTGGTASAYIENEYNVQTAWHNLKVNYEGTDAKQAIIQRARNDIQNAHFTRETVNFKFNDYCVRHLRANSRLDRYQANIDPTSQVTAFLKGIKSDNRVNPELMSVKTTVATHPTASKDIRLAVELFKSTMIQVGINLSQRERSHIGATERQGGRGRGCFHRGGRSGRGRGGGRGRGRGGRYGQRNQSGNNQGGDYYIPQDVIDQLTP